jgi:hypothetical protein
MAAVERQDGAEKPSFAELVLEIPGDEAGGSLISAVYSWLAFSGETRRACGPRMSPLPAPVCNCETCSVSIARKRLDSLFCGSVPNGDLERDTRLRDPRQSSSNELLTL